MKLTSPRPARSGIIRAGASTAGGLHALARLLFLASFAGACAAATPEFTVHGGEEDVSQVIVTFDAPKEWRGSYSVNAKGGTGSGLLQVDGEGRAAAVINRVAKGAAVTFVAGPLPQTLLPAGLLVKQEGSLLHLQRFRSGRPQTMLSYQMEAGDVPEGVAEVFRHGAHLHPVYTPSGALLTGNHPADHRWHRGIWMAWTHTEFQGRAPDFWNQGKGTGKDKAGELLAEVRFAQLVKSWGGPVQAGFTSKHRFIDHSSGTEVDVLNETWEVTAYALHGAQPCYVVDFVSTQTCAGATALKLPKYHYGGLGVRGNAQWDPVDKVSMLTSNGDDRAKGDSTKARWVRMGGDVDGKPAGMAILIHPDNFRFPQPLRLNPKNPQLCVAPSQDGDWTLEPGKPYTSRYRFVLADGPADAGVIEAAWKAYAKPLKVTY